MSQTITVRIPKDLSAWLEQAAARTGVSQGRIVREQLEKARKMQSGQRFMRLAGVVRGANDLSKRKGFSKL